MENKTKKEGDKYSHDFRNLKFTGTSASPIAPLVINWLFILLITAMVCGTIAVISYFLKIYVLPFLAPVVMSKKFWLYLGSFTKIWKGGTG